jgi:hypothetical protein
MVAAIESGNFNGDEHDVLDCDSVSDDEDSKLKHRPSTGSLRSRPKTSGQTELPIEVRLTRSSSASFTHQRSSRRSMRLISFCARLVASPLYTHTGILISPRVTHCVQGWDARDHDRCTFSAPSLLQLLVLTAAQVSPRAKSVRQRTVCCSSPSSDSAMCYGLAVCFMYSSLLLRWTSLQQSNRVNLQSIV